jgi:hypothetical protein
MSETATKKKAAPRTAQEQAQRKIKEQIAVLQAKPESELPATQRRLLVDYLTGVNYLIAQTPLVLSQQNSEPFAMVVSLGRAQLNASDLFKKPASAEA